MKKNTNTITFIMTALLLIYLLAGCSNDAGKDDISPSNILTESETPSPAESEPPGQSQAGTEMPNQTLGTANLEGSVVSLLDSGVTVRPVVTSSAGDGLTAEITLGDDASNDVTVMYTEDTVFQIAELDRATYAESYSGAASGDVKKESSIYVWGTYRGMELTADRVVIARFV